MGGGNTLEISQLRTLDCLIEYVSRLREAGAIPSDVFVGRDNGGHHVDGLDHHQLLIQQLRSAANNRQASRIIMDYCAQNHSLPRAKVCTREFANQLVPHLNYSTTGAALYMCLYRKM